MDELVFFGDVRGGQGDFSALGIPGCNLLGNSPDDWPELLFAGSLNVRISDVGFPRELLHRCPEKTLLKKLDGRCFLPAFEIPHALIEHNTVFPKNESDSPDRGNAQVWRAVLDAYERGVQIDCWVLRRIESGLCKTLELVSDKRLRTELGIGSEEAAKVRVCMFGTWADG